VTLSRQQVQAWFDQTGGHPSRALGQNFVVDANTVRRIVRMADINETSKVVEIGAGLGSLTLAIAETGASVVAIEIDRHVLVGLKSNVGALSNVSILHADAMELAWDDVLPPAGGPYTLIANLPYNIATPLIADLLDFVPQITTMLVMVQKEVAERFAATPRTPAYGAVTVKVQYWGVARMIGTVAPSVFLPRPNVDSGLVRIDRHASGPLVPEEEVRAKTIFGLVKAGFAQRRKMLRGNLSGKVTETQFGEAGVASTARAEELDIHDWIRLARAVGNQLADESDLKQN
jgi:16S rRNA (adenine1518-N6/adenine1519-N6)-dimethyltransferase